MPVFGLESINLKKKNIYVIGHPRNKSCFHMHFVLRQIFTKLFKIDYKPQVFKFPTCYLFLISACGNSV